MDFQIGDIVSCHPMGIGKIIDIQTQQMGDMVDELTFYVIKDYFSDTTFMIPTRSKNKMRSLPDENEINDIFNIIKESNNTIQGKINLRYMNCVKKVKTGQLKEIAEVVSSLLFLNKNKSLSVSERKLLNDSKAVLAREIALSLETEEEEILEKIDNCA